MILSNEELDTLCKEIQEDGDVEIDVVISLVTQHKQQNRKLSEARDVITDLLQWLIDNGVAPSSDLTSRAFASLRSD